MSEDKDNCKHEVFQAQVNVHRLTGSNDSEEIISYMADVNVWCSVCGQAFEWIGAPCGLSPTQPMVSADFMELRAPIRPANLEVIPTDSKEVN